MGAKTWMLVASDEDCREALRNQPALDRESTLRLCKTLFPDERVVVCGESSLQGALPYGTELIAGVMDGVTIVASFDFLMERPSQLPARFLKALGKRNVYLHCMISTIDGFSYAHWIDGELQRSLSLAADSGVIENIGEPFAFEQPYWAGEYPASDPDEEPDGYPFVFHPLDLGEAALREFFGYQLEGYVDASLLEPDSIPLLRLERRQYWWRRWLRGLKA
jgi:hypothetical protein